MWSFDQELSVGRFLRLPFRTLNGRGFAGLVFLLARSADAPGLQRQFFEHWSDLDDLTGRYIGVFSPFPGRRLQLALQQPDGTWGQGSILVNGLQCAGEPARLYRSSRVSPRAVRMGTEQPRQMPGPVGTATATRPGSLSDHQLALTLTVSAMQEFFGIPGSLVPCAVVVSLEERKAFAVALEEGTGFYGLLKRVMTRIEPVIPRIKEKDAELVAELEARERHRSDTGRLRRSADAVREEWAAHTRRLADELRDVAGRLSGEEAASCEWMAGRLGRDEPIAGDEWTSVRSLLRALETSGAYGRLPRRLRRTLGRLNRGGPESEAAPRRLAEAEAEEEAIQVRIGRVKRHLDELGRELRLGAAVVGAAQELGLALLPEPALLAPRGLGWSLSVLASEPFAIRPRSERA